MPGDDLVERTSRLEINHSHGGGDLADEATAELRLRQEAQMQQKSAYAPPLNRGIRDVTADFVAATRKLPPGELVKDEYFTLFEAVGALEIMDPKMDSGYVPPGDSFESDFDVCGELEWTEILWIMDELFRLEMNFHSGLPLSQNIYTSLHVFRLINPDNDYPYFFRYDGDPTRSQLVKQQLIHTVLRAYCVGLIKCVECVLQEITASTYYEEEDFVTHQFGRELLPKVDAHEAREMLIEAMDFVDTIPDGETGARDFRYALKHRLVIREHLLFSMSGRDQQWRALQKKFQEMDKTHEWAKPAPAAFSDKVTRQLATSTPPRPDSELSWQTACQKWTQLCGDIMAANMIISQEEHRPEPRPHALLTAIWNFAYRRPGPGTYARAIMQRLLTQNGEIANAIPHGDIVYCDTRDLVLAADLLTSRDSFEIEVTSDPRNQAIAVMDKFIRVAIPEYISFYHILVQNHGRMRRLLTKMITSLRRLEEYARECDTSLHEIGAAFKLSGVFGNTPYPAPSLWEWTVLYKLRCVVWVIQMGFEEDLYLDFELRLMFTILGEMGGAILKSLERVRGARAARLLFSAQNEECKVEMARTAPYFGYLKAQYTFTHTMGHCLVGLCGLLEHVGLIKTMPRRFENKQYQYEARMKHLLVEIAELAKDYEWYETAQPRFCIGHTLQKVLVEPIEQVKLLHQSVAALRQWNADDCNFPGTQKEWEEEVNKMVMVCVAFNVTMGKLKRLCENHGIETFSDEEKQDLTSYAEVVIPPLEQRRNKWWLVPEIKEKPSPQAV